MTKPAHPPCGLDLDDLFQRSQPTAPLSAPVLALSGIDLAQRGPALAHAKDIIAQTKPSVHAGSRDLAQMAQLAQPKTGGGRCNEPNESLGKGGSEGVIRATLHYRLHDERNGYGSILGVPGDTMADLLADLLQRYGPRLDLESVREAFEERSAILEFDGLLPRHDAEPAAAGEVAGLAGHGSFRGERNEGNRDRPSPLVTESNA